MKKAKRDGLEAKGWKVGTVTEFLDLSASDAAYIELKLAIGQLLKELRLASEMTQSEAAVATNTSQSRYSTLENGSEACTLDLQISTLLTMGCTPDKIVTALDHWAADCKDLELGAA